MNRIKILLVLLLGCSLPKNCQTAYFGKTTRRFSDEDLQRATSQIQTESVVECILHCDDAENSVMKNDRCYCMDDHVDDGSYYSMTQNTIEEADVFKAYSEKLNEEPVCYQALGRRPGSFALKRNSSIDSIRLEHVSGWMSCMPPHIIKSYWGCGLLNFDPFNKNDTFLTIITDNELNPQFPFKIYNSQNQLFTLPRFNHDSKEIVLTAPDRVPYSGHAGEIMKIWFGEDFLQSGAYDNNGTHCVNIYATYR